jgi:two-component system, OmpR family, response regulator CpxR
VARVLIVDDDVELCELLEEFLGQEGYVVESYHRGSGAAEEAVSGAFDLVVLDVMLPGCSGFEVLRRIRASSMVPILMLTARGEEVDRIVGLEMGADDYLPKPFSPRELAARMRAVLRRIEPRGAVAGPRPEALEVGDLALDPGARTATLDGDEVRLTGIEFSLLELLVRHAGTVVGRDELSQEVLGRRANSFDRSLDVHVSNLRRKLGPLADGGERIKTVRGVGYLYVHPALEG